MKIPLILLSAALLSAPSHAQDPVDRAKTSYDERLRKGMEKLNFDHITELETIRSTAIKNSDLATATKADARIKEFEQASKKLAEPAIGGYPANADYKMVWSNRERSSEHGKEIVCRFQRVSRLDAAKGTLVLVLKTDASAYSNSPNDILIMTGGKRREIGRIKGIGTNKTIKIPLTLSAEDDIEIAVVNKGDEAVRLKLFAEGIPELYLEVTQ